MRVFVCKACLIPALCASVIVLTACRTTLSQSTNETRPCAESSAASATPQQSMPQDKDSLTPAQQKIDSQLLIAIRQRRGAPTDQTGTTTLVKIDQEGNTVVDISAIVTPALLAGIERLGGKVLSKYEEYQTVRARLPLAKLETLAALNDVRFIMPAAEATTNRPMTNQTPDN